MILPALRLRVLTAFSLLWICSGVIYPSDAMRISVVTGSNKGIGLALVKKLAQAPGHLCVLTSRNPVLGQKAADDLKAEGLDSVVVKQLDIGDPASVERFASEIEQEYGRVDILVNNAGMCFKSSDPTPFKEQAEPTLKTNFFDTVAFTEKLIPLVRKSSAGRIVNVASMTGHLSILESQSQRDAFADPALSKEKLNSLMTQFIADVKAGKYRQGGWPGINYGMSKLGLIAYSNVAARVEQEEGSNVLVNSCCPGYTATDLTAGGGMLTTEEGARTPFAVTQMKNLEEGGHTGRFFRNEAPVVW